MGLWSSLFLRENMPQSILKIGHCDAKKWISFGWEESVTQWHENNLPLAWLQENGKIEIVHNDWSQQKTSSIVIQNQTWNRKREQQIVTFSVFFSIAVPEEKKTPETLIMVFWCEKTDVKDYQNQLKSLALRSANKYFQALRHNELLLDLVVL